MSGLESLQSLPPLREVIAAHGLRADKALGQNFLLDQNLTDKITRLANVPLETSIIEIGPGPGGLTRSLLRHGYKNIIAVEYDPRAVTALQSLKEAAPGRLDIVEADALHTDVTALAAAPRAIIANLPYNIATPLLVGWLRQIHADHTAFHSMSLMFQKEVAQRIAAAPGGKTYGRLSVLAQWLCETRRIADLPPAAFTPPPKIWSSVVRFAPRLPQPDAPSFESVEKITAAAFGQRRKMIRSSLRAYMPAIEACGLDPTLRAEDLPVGDFIRLAAFKGLSPHLGSARELGEKT